MKHTEAIQALYNVLNNQQTVSTKKLQSLLTDANISLESSESKEVNYLKREIRNLVDKNKELKSKLKTKNRKIDQLKGE